MQRLNLAMAFDRTAALSARYKLDHQQFIHVKLGEISGPLLRVDQDELRRLRSQGHRWLEAVERQMSACQQ